MATREEIALETRRDVSDIPHTIWVQKKPEWCPYRSDCNFRRRVQDGFCGGELPEPSPHNGDLNYYRICFNSFEDGHIEKYQVNNTDLEYLRWVFDALDGKQTSWISKHYEK